ncbi:cyclin-dependent kinase inhibitor 1Ba [Esox lucius]|uniref:cyclin-dependent kinase inhibitor 1Ba n=1 Tax=Esox lucius TaxID=8010 RepID=UPI0014776C03|nr:cyclin-dependent kinase inhibitor 1Ba [Esox lucius]
MCNKMSNVRLSNGSPTLERVDACPTDNTKPSICRNLFGTGDPEERKRVCSLQIKEMAKNFSDKWNYDFINDEPLPGGTYTWELVESPAAFYTRQPHKRVSPTENMYQNGNHDYSCPTNESEVSTNTEMSERQTDGPISDNQARKRPSSPEPESPSKRLCSSEEVEVMSKSVQQTPSKKDSRTHEH